MLQGALQEFSLPEVFQLLTLTAKSGALRVQAGGRSGEVHFRSGAVTFAASDSSRMPLAARLVADGRLGEDQLEAALAAHRTGGAAALMRCLRDGGVDAGTLEESLREQIRDAVSVLMRAGEGTFAFSPGQPEEDHGDGLAIDADELVAEGRRRIDEWAAMCESLPSMEAVLALRPTLPADTESVQLSAAEWQLLAFVDGARRVRDIVELTGKGEHAGCQLLDGLVRNGLLEAVDVDSGRTGALGEVLARRAALQRLELTELGGAGAAPEEAAEDAPGEAAAARPAGTAELAVELHASAADTSAADGAELEPPAGGGEEPHEVPAEEVVRHRPLTRDEDVNKGLLLRLIDGVKGA